MSNEGKIAPPPLTKAAILAFWRDVFGNFNKNQAMYRASALTFTSLLAIVPLLSVTFTFFSIFPAFKALLIPLQSLIFNNFLPATGDNIQKHLLDFTEQASHLSFMGVTMLFVTAILLMLTIEKAMNQVWRVSKGRTGASAFLLYWTCLSTAPFFLALSLLASSYIFSLSWWGVSNLSLLVSLSPMLLTFIGYTLLYVIVPNCQVRLAHACCGALLASILLEFAKIGFQFYLAHFNAYNVIYGAFALVPFFFIWLYWLWIITLFCAEFTHSLASFNLIKRHGCYSPIVHAIRWLYHLYNAQQKGQLLDLKALINLDKKGYRMPPEEMLKILEEHRFILCHKNSIILLRNLKTVALVELDNELSLPFPKDNLPTSDALDECIHHYCQVRATTLATLTPITLTECFNQSIDI